MGCCVCVETGNVGLVETFGEFKETAQPGLTCINCCTTQVRNVNMKVQCLYVTCRSKTVDDVFVDVQVAVQYQVTDAQACVYTLDEPREQIKDYVFDVIRAEVPKQDLHQVFEEKEQLSEAVKASLKETMSQYGIKIVNTPVTNIDPDHKVKASLNAIITQQNMKKAATEKAIADAMVVKRKAEAHAERVKIVAFADQEAKYQSGEGLSKQRKAIIDGLTDSVQNFQEGVPGVDARTVMDLIMITQYFDMMEKIGCSPTMGDNTLFVPNNPGQIHTIAAQLRGQFGGGIRDKLIANSQSDGYDLTNITTDRKKAAQPSAPTMS